MQNNILITDISVKSNGTSKELGGYIDGEYIFFKVPKEFQLLPSAEWFVAIALLEAMVSNKSLEVDREIPMSKELLNRLHELQSIFACWNPKLKIIDIFARATSKKEQFNSVGSFFSAGVDSSHTLIDEMENITHLIMLRVFDMGDDQELWEQRVHKQTDFAKSLGKSLVPVETNARDWLDKKKIAWGFAHGLLLSAAGTALGLKRLYVPSSYTYDHLAPWGSHPLSDPMWSTESTQVIHHGAGFRRTAKTKAILAHSVVADNLQVCWNSMHKNCGTCSKCIRSMVAIHLLGGKVNSLPTLGDLKLLESLKSTSESGALFLEDLAILAKEVGNKKIQKTLWSLYKSYPISQFSSLVDRYLLGGVPHRIYRKIKKPRWLDLRVTLLPQDRWEDD